MNYQRRGGVSLKSVLVPRNIVSDAKDDVDIYIGSTIRHHVRPIGKLKPVTIDSTRTCIA
jgi:hypothetical protein